MITKKKKSITGKIKTTLKTGNSFEHVLVGKLVSDEKTVKAGRRKFTVGKLPENLKISKRIEGIRSARINLSDCIARAKDNGPLVLTKHNRPIAVLYAVSENANLEEVLIATAPEFQKALFREKGKALSEDEFKVVAGIPD